MFATRTPLQVLLAALVLSATGVASAQEGPPARLALLIGIDHYAEGSGIEPLGGCVNDIARVQALLTGRFDFEPGDLLVLLDEQATLEAILRSFDEWLLRRAGPDTEVVFWFSGHGSRLPDRSGERGAEVDGLDTSLLAHDSRSGGRRGEYDLTDDVLGSLFAALGERTRRVLAVTDSCHSGGGLRGARPVGVRGVPVGERPLDPLALRTFWPEGVALREDVRFAPTRDTWVHVAACAATQLAQEIEVDVLDGQVRRHGALTWSLCAALEEALPGASFRQVARSASLRLSKSVPGQDLQCEGALDRELFGGRYTARRPGFAASPRSAKELFIEAGSLHGLREGSRLAVRDDADDTLLGQARVRRVRALRALAEFEEAPARPLQGRALRALELSRPQGVDVLRIHTGDEQLAAFLAELDDAAWAPAASADLFLERTADGSAELSTREGLRLLQLKEGGGEAVEREDQLERVREVIRLELRFRANFELASQPGSWPLPIRMDRPTEAEMSRWRPSLRERFGPQAEVVAGVELAENASAHTEWRAALGGDAVAPLGILVVENPYDRPLHVSVLSVVEDRTIATIWPTGSQRGNLLAPGDAPLRIPFIPVANPRWSLERPMRDRYLAIATEEYFDFGVLQQGAQLRSGAPELPGILREAIDAQPRTRGSRQNDVSGANWGVSFADLLVSSD